MGSTPSRVLRTHLHSNQDETNAREEKTTGFGSPRIGTTSEQGNHTLTLSYYSVFLLLLVDQEIDWSFGIYSIKYKCFL